MAIGAWIVADLTVRIVFGTEYTGAARPWAVLMIALVLTSLVRPAFVLLRAQKRLGPANAASWTTVLVNFALNLLLIPRYGILGAALATVASEALVLVFSGWLVRRDVNPPRAARALAPSFLAALTIDETFAQALEITKHAIASPLRKKAPAKPRAKRTT